MTSSAKRIEQAIEQVGIGRPATTWRNAEHLALRADMAARKIGVDLVDTVEAVAQAIQNLGITLKESGAGFRDTDGVHEDDRFCVTAWVSADGWVEIDLLWRC